jgi:hypothetical protein
MFWPNFQRVAFCPKNNRLISLCAQSIWLLKLSNLFKNQK